MARLRTSLPPDRVRHKAAKFSALGQVSALCYPIARCIPFHRGEWWTLDDAAVTCPACLTLIKEGRDGPLAPRND